MHGAGAGGVGRRFQFELRTIAQFLKNAGRDVRAIPNERAGPGYRYQMGLIVDFMLDHWLRLILLPIEKLVNGGAEGFTDMTGSVAMSQA